jgi:hypothetical protein
MACKKMIVLAVAAVLSAAVIPTDASAFRGNGGFSGGFHDGFGGPRFGGTAFPGSFRGGFGSGPMGFPGGMVFRGGFARPNIRADIRDIRRDRIDFRLDRRQLRRDLRLGNPAQVARDRADIARDRVDPRADRADLRREFRAFRSDR